MFFLGVIPAKLATASASRNPELMIATFGENEDT